MPTKVIDKEQYIPCKAYEKLTARAKRLNLMEDIKIALQAVRLFFPNANTIRILVETTPEEHLKFSEEVMKEAGPKLQESNPDLYNALLDGTKRFSDVTFGGGTAIHIRSNVQS